MYQANSCGQDSLTLTFNTVKSEGAVPKKGNNTMPCLKAGAVHLYIVFENLMIYFFNRIYWGDTGKENYTGSGVHSITHHLCVVLCIHHPKSSLLPSPLVPPLPSSTSHPLPLW